jgi:putative addiction module component (TIGR02574 family)
MTNEAKGLLPQVLALSESDKLELLDLLSELTTPPNDPTDWDPEFKAELKRRVEELESGKFKGIPSEEVDRKMREKYG